LKEDFKRGDLVKLYSMYEAHIEEPSVVGVYLRTGQEAQFTFYEIAVVKENLWARTARPGGFVERYLASDFVMVAADEELMKNKE
jgi:hypothetical protein|tara:strand:+ start:832 stop:1086 length:255 start_codon:yes stop_codon:yes gene_type:complete